MGIVRYTYIPNKKDLQYCGPFFGIDLGWFILLKFLLLRYGYAGRILFSIGLPTTTCRP